MDQWYIIRTKAKKEKAVLEQLRRARYDLFFPHIQGVLSPKPLFPCYLFVRTDFEKPNNYQLIRFTRGVYKILGNEQGPEPVSELIVQALRERTKDGCLLEQDLLFREGDEVIIKRGILKDLKGMIEKKMTASGRIQILFKWLNMKMKAVVKYRDIEKIK